MMSRMFIRMRFTPMRPYKSRILIHMDSSKRIIIGIDPGSRTTGYGVIRVEGTKQIPITFGQIHSNIPEISERLRQIYAGLQQVIALHQPTEVAIEQIFTLHNHQSALKLGQARGVALVATADFHLPVFEYSAKQ